ncbi:MAG: alpha/beta hydrolase, partial [Pseudomonadota bacterium]
WCGFDLDPGSAQSMIAGGLELAAEEALRAVRPDLPILMVSGDADPLHGGGALIDSLTARLAEAGLTQVEVQLYPGARHELLNETNRDQAVADILAWLSSQLGSK